MRERPPSKETPVSVDGRLLKPMRKMARHHADREIQTRETSLRSFWDQWDEEIASLQFKIDPFVKKVFDYSNEPVPPDDAQTGPAPG
ncbi:MAG: hypothetical protein ACE5E0_06635 [Terriglobia bacterium]